MSEHTREQYEAIKETEENLIALSADLARIRDGSASVSWALAWTLVDRDLDEITCGELRRLVQEAQP
jgi:hypothetical protein